MHCSTLICPSYIKVDTPTCDFTKVLFTLQALMLNLNEMLKSDYLVRLFTLCFASAKKQVSHAAHREVNMEAIEDTLTL